MEIKYNTWYYLDPDNRKDPPEKGMFCERCKKKIVNLNSCQPIKLHEENPWFKVVQPMTRADGFIGKDCLKIVTEKYGEQK